MQVTRCPRRAPGFCPARRFFIEGRKASAFRSTPLTRRELRERALVTPEAGGAPSCG